MNRRNFITGTLSSTVLLASGGVAWLNIDNFNHPLTLIRTLENLQHLEEQFHRFSSVQTQGNWELAQILQHCAQSVEYSLHGFPHHKPEWFKSTLGRWAFSAFSSKGKMHHNLSEGIPGAPILSTEQNIPLAIQRFRQSLINFQQWEQNLAPHFAYGELSKAEYEKAHVMHFNDHLTEIMLQAPS